MAPSRAPIDDAAATARATTTRRLRRELAGDLDTILQKALRKSPAERYAGATALADDLARHRDHLPIVARPPSAWYTFTRFVRRHAVAVAAGGNGGRRRSSRSPWWRSLCSSVPTRRRSARAPQAEVAQAVQAFMTDLFSANGTGAASLEQTRAMTAEQLLDRGAAKIERGLDDAPKAKAALLKLFGEMYEELDRYPQSLAMHERSVAQARAVYGGSRASTRSALLEHAWVAHRLISRRRSRSARSRRPATSWRASRRAARTMPKRSTCARRCSTTASRTNRWPRARKPCASWSSCGRRAMRAAFAKATLAKAYRWQGNLDAAARCYESAKADYLRDFGPDVRGL